MKFVMPIKGKSAQELYKLNREGHGGFYPIGVNNSYHGGIHFEGERLPVVAIADGTIIAYRYNRKYLEEKNGDKTYRYSNCFVLIQHDYTTPKGQKLTFYSHYNNLSPWDELMTWIRDNEQFPNIVIKPGYKINTEGLLLRSSPEIKDGVHHNHVGSLNRGQDVIATPVNDHPGWAKKEGVNEYFCYTHNHASAKPIVCEPQFDQIVSSCSLPIKAGSIVGYSGLCEAEGAPPNYTLTHVEVFASDDAEDFVKNPKGDGKLTQIKITAPKRDLCRRDKLYPDITEIDSFTRNSGTIVDIKDRSNDSWIKVEDKKFVATVRRDWLDYANHHYTAKAEYLDQIDDKFPDIDITSDTKFSLVRNHGTDDRVISVDAPDPKEYWIKRSLLGSNNALKETSDDCYVNNPDAVSYPNIGTIPYDCTASSKAISHDEGIVWHQVEAGGMQGWIKESDVTKVSPYDWLGCGFSSIKEEDKDKSIWSDHSKTEDSRIDIEYAPEPFKSILNAIDTTPDGKISQDELLTAMATPATAYKLSRLICRHQTEWWYDDGLPLYKEVINKAKELLGQKSSDNLKTRIEQMCWWNEASSLPSKTTYHFHPLSFIEQMTSINGFNLSFNEIKQIDHYATDADINKHLNGINEAISDCEIDTGLKAAHFLAQLLTESANLKYTSEQCSQQVSDEKYGGYKGRGLMQLTYLEAYQGYGRFVKEDFTGSLENKQKLENPPHAAKSAGWVWAFFKKLNDPAERNDLIYITYRINGGFNGYDYRLKYAKAALYVLCPGQAISTDYSIGSSMAAQDLKSCFSWGIWHDPTTTLRPGCSKDSSKALEGYKKFIELHDSLGKPIPGGNWYKYEKNTIRHFVEERISALS